MFVRNRTEMQTEEKSNRKTSVNETDFRENKNLILIGFGTHSELRALSEFDRFSRHFDGYIIHIFNLTSARRMLETWKEVDALNAFDKLSHDVMRADLFRIIATYHMGGFYIDLKSGVQFNTLKNVTKIVTKIVMKVQFEKEICIKY